MKWLATTMALVAALVGCGGRHAETGAAAVTDTAGLTPAQLTFLKFERVAEMTPPDVDDLNGIVEFDEQHTARLGAIAGGRVSELLVQVGDPVVEGQPLLAIESADVKIAQADRVRADADLTMAERNVERTERLRAAGAIAEKDRLQAREDLEKAKAESDRARAALDRLGLTPGDPSRRYFLRAPFAGTVVERRAAVGTEASPESGEPLVVVSDLSLLRVTLRLPERQVGLVRPGDSVGIRVPAYPEEFAGSVAQVGDVVEEATRTIPVRCQVPNPERRLKPAMYARVRVHGADAARALIAVPTAAILSDGEQFQVVVRRDDGTLEVRAVTVGAELGDHIEVRQGLRPGDEIVSEGALFAARQLAAS